MWALITTSLNDAAEFGGKAMRHVLVFLAVIHILLFLLILNRNEPGSADSKPVVRIFGYASFTGAWGAGPRLKEIFEKTCQCEVQFIEASDNGMLLQRLKLEGQSLGADLVVGFDQFDLQKALAEQTWQKLNFSGIDLEPEIKERIRNDYFVPYDWGVLSFMTRGGERLQPASLKDLLKPEYRGRILLQDPRTSSPGFQFVWWVLKAKGEEEGFRFLAEMMKQAHSWSPSWSSSIGLYNRNQAPLVFSYSTSPLYYATEEGDDNHKALMFVEPHPLQVEFAGIPVFCRQCELAEEFLNLMLSVDGQRLLMEKNYMLPVLRGVAEGTSFATAGDIHRTLRFEVPSDTEVDRIIQRWTEIRRGETSP